MKRGVVERRGKKRTVSTVCIDTKVPKALNIVLSTRPEMTQQVKRSISA